jgi:hypothetical protein
MFGSRTLGNYLLVAGLVDELHLMIGATALHGGTPAFGGPAPALELLDVRRRDGSQNVLLYYQVLRGSWMLIGPGRSALLGDLLQAVEHHLPVGSRVLGLLGTAVVVLS